MRKSIIFTFILFTWVTSFSQSYKAEWKFKTDFENEFNGKYIIDEENGAIVIPAVIAEFPSLTKEEIFNRIKNFADKRVQLKPNETDNSNFSFNDNSILLTEDSPYIKTGKYCLTDNYVKFKYTYKIEVKDERARLSIAIVGSIGIVGGIGSWPQNKYFKKHSLRSYTYFYEYAKELIDSTKKFVTNFEGNNDEW